MRLTATGTIASLIVSQLAGAAALAQDARNLPPPGWNTPGEFAGTERCAAYGRGERSCRVRTEGRVQLLQVEQGRCREGRDWDYGRQEIRVRNNCVAVFGYGYANQRPPAWNNDFAGTIDCATYSKAQQRCFVNTQNRVQLLNDRSGRCVAGQNWGYTQEFIWVSRRCAATFGYGYGYNQGGGHRPGHHDGPSAGAVIGGVAVAAGLIALLASRKSKNAGAKSGAGAATVQADLSGLPSDARNSVRACLDEAARQVGATGATRLRLDRVRDLRWGNNSWSLSAETTATYPDETQSTPFTCRANGSRVEELNFTN